MKLLNLITSLLIALVAGTAFAHALDISLETAVLGTVGVSAALSFVPMPSGPGILSAVVLREMWETAMIEPFRAFGQFLAGIPRKDQYVGNNTINLTEIGADPNVLINNTSYPIATAGRTDDNIAIALYKYDTENTVITDDELYALPYDKPNSVVRQHRDVLTEKILAHSLYGLCVPADSATTPVLETTGADDGTGRLRLTRSDIIKFQRVLDELNVPMEGRRLVLCPKHYEDLLLEDATLNMPVHNVSLGMVRPDYYGFQTYKYTNCPLFDSAGDKKAFGASTVSGDRQATVFFILGRSFQAQGTLKFYYRDAATDPENRETVAGYRVYGATLPLKNTGFGALISANA